jgi:hypothetical protein
VKNWFSKFAFSDATCTVCYSEASSTSSPTDVSVYPTLLFSTREHGTGLSRFEACVAGYVGTACVLIAKVRPEIPKSDADEDEDERRRRRGGREEAAAATAAAAASGEEANGGSARALIGAVVTGGLCGGADSGAFGEGTCLFSAAAAAAVSTSESESGSESEADGLDLLVVEQKAPLMVLGGAQAGYKPAPAGYCRTRAAAGAGSIGCSGSVGVAVGGGPGEQRLVLDGGDAATPGLSCATLRRWAQGRVYGVGGGGMPGRGIY